MKDACQTESRVWRKLGEGLQLTAKGSKELAGGRRLHLMAAIAHGKGIIMTEPYEKMSGDYFASFIRRRFNITFAKAGEKENLSRRFIMDIDPCQTSKKSLPALSEVEAVSFTAYLLVCQTLIRLKIYSISLRKNWLNRL